MGNSGGSSEDKNADRNVSRKDFKWEQGLCWELDCRLFMLHCGKELVYILSMFSLFFFSFFTFIVLRGLATINRMYSGETKHKS
jgi:hypothetical protein